MFWRWLTRSLLVLAVFALLGVARPTNAATFNPNRIIATTDMTNAQGFDTGQILTFLRRQGGYLAGDPQYAEAISKAAANNGIAPQFLLAHIQKESSLIDDPSPSQHRIDYALGYGCADNGSCDPATRGFTTQVRLAAQAFRGYLDSLRTRGTTISGWRVGSPKRTGAARDRSNPADSGWEAINGKPVYVTPQNEATAALYTYTPWVGGHTQVTNGVERSIGGNALFWNIWNRYFRRIYPDGSLLKISGSNDVWLIQRGERRRFSSQLAFLSSYDPSRVITVRREDVEFFSVGPPIRFANFSLLRAPNGGVYLLANGKKRPIESSAVFRAIGFNPDEVIRVSWADLAPYPDGEKITAALAGKPQGVLYRIRETGGVFWLDEQNVQHPILTPEILRARFPYTRPQPIKAVAANRFVKGEPLPFPDGMLVSDRKTKKVFVISNGERRPIANMQVFRAYGFRWKNVIQTHERALNLHPLGQPLTLVSGG
jgi:hypothetical protein